MPPPAEELVPRLFLGPALRAQSDKRLVRLVRDGYEMAFEEIVRRYGVPLRRYAAAIVGGHAEDVTQDSFTKALQALRRDDVAEIELRPWLYRIVRNTALNDLRDRPRQAEELAAAIAGGRSAAEEAEQHQELVELMERLRALPERQRAAIVMRELEGLGHEEIAAALGVSGGAARQAIHRARTALRDAVGLFIPLPLLRMLIDHGAEATVAAGAGGAAGAAAAGAAAGGAGGGVALKAGLATALIAGSVGTGVALDRDRQEIEANAPPAAASESRLSSTGSARGAGSVTSPNSGDSDDRSGRGSEPGDDSGHREGEDADADSSGPSPRGGSGHSGPGSGHEVGSHSGSGSHSGPSSSSGSGSGGIIGEIEDHSGPGGGGEGLEEGSGGGSGSSGSSSGPGSGEAQALEGLSSGSGNSGSGSSGSGSGSSGEDDD